MMKSVSVISALLVLLSVTFASAQSQQGGRYVFVISKVNYLKAIDDAVSQSKLEGLALSEARVIFCGDLV
jgi:hypothetical protein